MVSIQEHFRPYTSENQEWITPNMILVKSRNTKNEVLKDGSIIEQGDLIGQLHVFGIDAEPEWERLLPYERGLIMSGKMLIGFLTLALKCQEDDEKLRGINYFYGLSDLIKPRLIERFGFETEKKNDSLTYTKIYLRRMGMTDYKEMPHVGQLYQMWISRDTLVGSIPEMTKALYYFLDKMGIE